MSAPSYAVADVCSVLAELGSLHDAVVDAHGAKAGLTLLRVVLALADKRIGLDEAVRLACQIVHDGAHVRVSERLATVYGEAERSAR